MGTFFWRQYVFSKICWFLFKFAHWATKICIFLQNVPGLSKLHFTSTYENCPETHFVLKVRNYWRENSFFEKKMFLLIISEQSAKLLRLFVGKFLAGWSKLHSTFPLGSFEGKTFWNIFWPLILFLAERFRPSGKKVSLGFFITALYVSIETI